MWESNRISGIIHLIGHLSMMQMFPSISGFDSGSGAHFHSESVQRFNYCNKIEHFTLMERVCESQFELVL